MGKIGLHMQNWVKNNSSIFDIAKWASASFSIKIITAGFQFLFNILLARSLGAENVGKYFLCFSIVNAATIIGIFGSDKALMRLVSISKAKNNLGAVSRVFNIGLISSFICSLIVVIILTISSEYIIVELLGRENLVHEFRIFVLAILPLAVVANLTEAFKGSGKIIWSLSLKGMLSVLLVIALLIIITDSSLSKIISTYVVSISLIAFGGLGYWYLSNRKKHDIKQANTLFSVRDFFKSSYPLFWLSVFQQIIIWSPTFILGIWETDSNIGQFAIAQRIAILTSLFLIAFNTVLAAKVGKFFANQDIIGLERTIQKTTLLIIIMATPIFIFLFVFAKFTLSFFGDEFVGASYLLRIMLIGQFISVILGPVGLILIIGGNEKTMRNIMMLSAFLTVSCSITCIPLIGVTGASIAVALTMSIQNIIAAIFVFRKYKIITLPSTTLIKQN